MEFGIIRLLARDLSLSEQISWTCGTSDGANAQGYSPNTNVSGVIRCFELTKTVSLKNSLNQIRYGKYIDRRVSVQY